MDEVAAEAKVSRATVSRVLSDSAGVQEETRRRVLGAINRLGYVPNLMAQSLATRSSPVIGLLLRNPRKPVYGLLHGEVQDRADEVGLELITVVPSSSPGVRNERRALHKLLGLRVGGLLIATGVSRTDDLAQFLGVVPVVAVGRPECHDEIHGISYDEPAHGRMIAETVLAHGHRRVCVIAPAESVSVSESQRAEAMITTLAEAGARPERLPVVRSAPRDGCVEAVELVRRREVSCVCLPSDERALAFLSAAERAGLVVPQDVSVTGVDGITAGLDLVGLATIRLPVATVAEQAVRLMAELVHGAGAPVEHHAHRGTFLPGRSLAAPPQHAEP